MTPIPGLRRLFRLAAGRSTTTDDVAEELELHVTLRAEELVAEGQSLIRLQRVDLGFESRNILAVWLTLPFTRYEGRGQVVSFYAGLLERARALPGVRAAAAVSAVPIPSPHPMPMSGPQRPTISG